MNRYSFPHKFFWILGLFIFLISPAFAQTEDNVGRVLLAADVLDLKVNVDTTVDIQGATHFFSSRHRQYAGGRVAVHYNGDQKKSFYTGAFMGFVWGRSNFLLNWEEPGLQSFEALDSRFSHFSIPFGYEANLSLANILTVSPYLSARMMYLDMRVTIGDEDYNDMAFKFGFGAGCKVALQLGAVRLAGGAGLTHILNEDIDFEMDDSLTFNTRTDGSSVEYFVGVELQ